MNSKKRDKIQRLLALANDANDEESMTALAKAQELMLTYKIDENEIFEYQQQQRKEEVITTIVYEGRPQKWLYRLARIIAENFRVKYYYVDGSPIEICFTGLLSDVQIAEVTFQYASGSVSYCARKFLQQPQIKRKRKRKWQMKQDYIEGYLEGLSRVFTNQVLTNGYELALQLPEVVNEHIEDLGLVKGKDLSHKVKDYEAYNDGVIDGSKFKSRDLIDC